MGAKLRSSGAALPRIFCVNWFRTDDNGKFVWPGFSENTRVLKWMLSRIEGKASGFEHVFGITPTYADLDWTGMDFSADRFARITSIDKDAWREEFALHTELFDTLAQGLPSSLLTIKQSFEVRLEQD